MPKTNCAVVGCGNSTQKINAWKTTFCDVHQCKKGSQICDCQPPFHLYPFPTARRSPERRLQWINKLKRVNPTNARKSWQPNAYSRICSVHFGNKDATLLPTLELGYSLPHSKSSIRKPPAVRNVTSVKKQLLLPPDSVNPEIPELSEETTSSHCSSETLSCAECIFCEDLYSRLLACEEEITRLKRAARRKDILIRSLQHRVSSSIRLPEERLTYASMKKDEVKLNYYTGVPNSTSPATKVFAAIHKVVSPLVRRLWRGKRVVTTKVLKKSPVKTRGPIRKLKSEDELLLTMMRLRLGLMNKDIAHRFGISPTLASQIFTSWLKALNTALHHLVYRPPKEAIVATMPERYRGHPDLRDVIDCSEIFIETPKDLHLQALTWSDYKHHNTIKFLISVTPTGMISFISKCFCGRASDKAITLRSGFMDLLEPFDEVMADKGFLIGDELATRLCSLTIPPGKRGTTQMTPTAVTKTKRVANLRIIVEQVIRKVKCFRIIKNTLPLSLVPHVDEILSVCAALSNLQPPINS